ncbi:metal cation symporter ZIP14-like [Porites lutea]|uniref:metal cation symporter ZIP14-like n=1 Tax=Porites lutea TaxID=51062 RepID=UPI003CC58B98
MFFLKIGVFLYLKLSLYEFVFSHQSRNHEHYSFKELQDAVNGDSLKSDDLQRLFDKLHFLNCTASKPSPDYRRCFSPIELHDIHGSSPSKALNSSEFVEISPSIVYCLLPGREKNSGQQRCDSPRNHSELFDSFTRNFSHGEYGITHEALDEILEEINKTIGDFLTEKKCFSAEDIFKEIEEGVEEGHHHREGEHSHEEEKVLNQHDFEKASASIILHLVKGYCIKEGHGHDETKPDLPSKEFFMEELFDHKKYLSEEDLESIAESLGIGKKSSQSTASSSSESHDGHNHRRRRSAASAVSSQEESAASHTLHRRTVDSHAHTNGGSSSCYSVDEMLTVFDIDHSIGADDYDFKQLCPAFVQQAKSGACKQQSNQPKTEPEKDMGKIWGYGIAAVTIISLTSVAGVATIPFLGKKMYKKIMAMLVALGVGTLAGDSLLHLLPHAFGLHQHEENAEGDSHADHSEEKGFIWKALVVLLSIYGYFLFETLMHLCLKSKFGDHGGHSHIDFELPGPSSRHMSFKNKRKCSRLEHHEGGHPLGRSDENLPMEIGDTVLTNKDIKDGFEDPKDRFPQGHQNTTDNRKRSLKHSLSRHSVFSDDVERSKASLKTISTVAWMIIIGDTLHNIGDGLAIGATFAKGGSSGVSGGISTSIAVFCHELPHELGDFAVLLTAGMTVKMALLANLLSALSCYIGLAIGIYVGQEDDVRFWIFALAAGIFLYVALVDMLPDLMHSETLQAEPVATFLLQNLGLVLGFAIMLIIAFYEEDLMAIKF